MLHSVQCSVVCAWAKLNKQNTLLALVRPVIDYASTHCHLSTHLLVMFKINCTLGKLFFLKPLSKVLGEDSAPCLLIGNLKCPLTTLILL